MVRRPEDRADQLRSERYIIGNSFDPFDQAHFDGTLRTGSSPTSWRRLGSATWLCNASSAAPDALEQMRRKADVCSGRPPAYEIREIAPCGACGRTVTAARNGAAIHRQVGWFGGTARLTITRLLALVDSFGGDEVAMGIRAKVQRNEAAMRAQDGKQRGFEALASTRYLRPVVAAHRAYLRAVVDDPGVSERDYWNMSCLPSTTPRRLSAINMRIMEVCVLTAPEDPETGAIYMYVILRRSVLGGVATTDADLGRQYPGLVFGPSDYGPAGTDQVAAEGCHDDLIEALYVPRFALAARSLAEHLLTSRSPYWECHNYQLADEVLRRQSEN